MPIEGHQYVVKYLIGRLDGYYDDKTADLLEKKRGKSVKRHGFDMGKLVSSSLFYMPCQAEDPKDSFFQEFQGNPLEPLEWGSAAITIERDPAIKRPVLEYENDNPEPVAESTTIQDIRNQLSANDNQTRIDKAKQVYVSTPSGMKMRHVAFFTLGLTLYRLGLADSEIITHLNDADADGSRRKKNSINDVMKSLKSRKYA